MDIFNNREIAVGFWLIVFVVYISLFKKIRRTVTPIFKIFLHWKFAVQFVAICSYVLGVIAILSIANFWDVSLLKDTILWFIFTSTMMTYRFIIAERGQVPFKKTILDNLKIVLVLEFIINTYTFSLGIELALVPVAIIIFALSAFASVNETDKQVAKLLGVLQVILGMIILINAIYGAILDFGSLASFTTIRGFLLPLILSLSFLPFAYLMALYTSYESLFIGFKFGSKKDSNLVRYARKEIFKHCHFNIGKVFRIKPFELMHLQSREDVDSLMIDLEGRLD